MSLFKFQDTVYLDYKKNWFAWEPAWESFRPITNVAWDGSAYVLDDNAYCSDPLSEFYGYGTPQMKQICDALTQKFASQISTAKPSSEIGNSEWFFDRRVSLTKCCPRTKDSWKKLIRGHNKTLRKPAADKFTRRNR